MARARGMPGPAAAERAARAIERGDPEYPPALLDLRDPPERVHLLGRLPAFARSVAIVGARAASPYGLAFASRLAGDLARLGIAVVSGLARGVDSAAHAGALDAGGATVAVLPWPVGEVPHAGAALAARVAARGALLSELDPGTPAFPGVFVERNRLIAALARAVVVVEAAERSGSLSTANAARRLGRPLLAVPGDVDRPTSLGTHALLRGGAAICTGATDVLDALERAPAPRASSGDPVGSADDNQGCGEGSAGEPTGSPEDATAPECASVRTGSDTPEARVFAALAGGEIGTDALAMAAKLPVQDALAALFSLRLAGAVESRPGQRWRRCRA